MTEISDDIRSLVLRQLCLDLARPVYCKDCGYWQ